MNELSIEVPEDLAAEILEAQGEPGRSFTQLEGGTQNYVFQVETDRRRLVLRIVKDRVFEESREIVEKEAWCLRKAGEHGIPSPKVYGVGTYQNACYVMIEYIEGSNASTAPEEEHWRILGEYARSIHEIRVPLDDCPAGLLDGGPDPDSKWRNFLQYNVAQLSLFDRLIDLEVYDPSQQQEILRRIEGLQSKQFRYGLCHGDLALRNLMLPPVGPPVLIDWGCAVLGPVPEFDFIELLLHHFEEDLPTWEGLQAFADGSGVDLDASLPTLMDIRLIKSLDLVHWALDRQPSLITTMADSARDCVRSILG